MVVLTAGHVYGMFKKKSLGVFTTQTADWGHPVSLQAASV